MTKKNSFAATFCEGNIQVVFGFQTETAHSSQLAIRTAWNLNFGRGGGRFGSPRTFQNGNCNATHPPSLPRACLLPIKAAQKPSQHISREHKDAPQKPSRVAEDTVKKLIAVLPGN